MWFGTRSTTTPEFLLSLDPGRNFPGGQSIGSRQFPTLSVSLSSGLFLSIIRSGDLSSGL